MNQGKPTDWPESYTIFIVYYFKIKKKQKQKQ